MAVRGLCSGLGLPSPNFSEFQNDQLPQWGLMLCSWEAKVDLWAWLWFSQAPCSELPTWQPWLSGPLPPATSVCQGEIS